MNCLKIMQEKFQKVYNEKLNSLAIEYILQVELKMR